MNIRKKLPVAIAALVAIPLLLTSSFTFVQDSKITKNQTSAHMNTITSNGTDYISALLEGEKKETQKFAEQKDIIELAEMRQNNSGESFFNEPSPQLKAI